jgi:RNA polymerase sigma-70 factor, ECF subfamily
MHLVSKGGREAFEVLYDRYFDKLVWFARSFTDDVQKAEDMVHEVFLRIIEKPGQFDTSRKFSTWVYTVTGNSCKNVLRNEKNRARLLEEHVKPQYERANVMRHDTDYRLLKEQLNTAYGTMSEKEKSIYNLRFEQELSIKEIAEIISIPEGSVKSGIYYLLKKISVHLKDFAHEK